MQGQQPGQGYTACLFPERLVSPHPPPLGIASTFRTRGAKENHPQRSESPQSTELVRSEVREESQFLSACELTWGDREGQAVTAPLVTLLSQLYPPPTRRDCSDFGVCGGKVGGISSRINALTSKVYYYYYGFLVPCCLLSSIIPNLP